MATMTEDPRAYEQRESRSIHLIEREAAKIPSDVFVWASMASIVGSLVVQLTARPRFFGLPSRRGQLSLFLGQWAPTFLLLGVYSKLGRSLGTGSP